MIKGEWTDRYKQGEDTPLLNRLMDAQDREPVVMAGEDGKDLEFEQCASIPYNGYLYVVFHPITPIEGIGEDECVVFRYEQKDGEEIFCLEEDEDVANEVYNAYIEMINEADEDEE